MVKKDRPKFPDSYIGDQASEYDSSNWMERNQKITTYRCIELLYDQNLINSTDYNNDELLLLDLGCGSGFSTEVLLEEKFRVISIDILPDMLHYFREKKIDGSIIILADIRDLPIRDNKIDHIISVSSFNFIYEDLNDDAEKNRILRRTSKDIMEILRENGRIVIEFYPESENDVKLLTKAFKSAGFDGFFVKDNPNKRKEQNYIVLKKDEQFGNL
jgi:18S rRNA (guanine1575-N7)-methyltransferase